MRHQHDMVNDGKPESGTTGSSRGPLLSQKLRNALLLALLILAPGLATALNLATSPLFLSSSAKPNIVFIGDDSPNMDWGMVTNEDSGIMTITCGGTTYDYRYTHPDTDTNNVANNASGNPPATNLHSNRVMPTDEVMPGLGAWRAWNKDYNKLYYDPSVTYSKWEGADIDGNTFTAITASSAPFNPYRPGTTYDGKIDLTNDVTYTTQYCSGGSLASTSVTFYPAMYYKWNGGSGSVPAAGDSKTKIEIKPANESLFTKYSTRTDCVTYTDRCSYTEEIQNFANWFSYYRKRDLAMKAAISQFVADTSDRVAYTAINNSTSTAINISISVMNGSATSGNGRLLLKGVFSTVPYSGGTARLRYGLDAVGRYFECTTGNAYGFPASSPGSVYCPIQSAASGGACQQNFAIMVTGDAWYDDFNTSAYAVGNTDYTAASGYDGGNYADASAGVENTLADIAMHYYERDLAPSLSDQVAVLAGVDENTKQHMVTYAVAIGLSGTCASNSACAGAWPSVAVNSSDTVKVDDLRHAAYNGRGEFLSAYAPDALRTALNSTKVSVAGRSGSAAAVAVNSRSLSTSTRLYQARFESSEWSGDLRALTIDTSGTVGSEVWSAKDQLKSQSHSSRVIYTRNGSRGILFSWVTSGTYALTATQQGDLSANVPSGWTTDNWGTARLNWLRGDSSNEGTGSDKFRERSDGFKLGDIVNSTPIFVGTPPYLADVDSGAHATFRSNYTTRTEMIYVGANDGMLHGFDASTGQEKMAYIPSMLFGTSGDPQLNKLTSTSYSHRFYVDGSPTVGDAYATFTYNCASSACWRTVLVSGLGGGGKGVFALDVTDPDGGVSGTSDVAFTNSNTNAGNIVLWEFTTSSDSDMGHVYGQPTVARVRTGSTTTAWVAIFGNGYDSSSGRPVLYIVNIKDGTLLKKIILKSSDSDNGLSTPAVVDSDGDYTADYVFAGDLKGNLWKIKLTGNNTSNWDSSYSSAGSPSPLFIAKDANDNLQPITVKPEIGSHSTGTGFMVYFGTGKYIETTDNSAASSPVNTFYGIWDKNDYSGSGTPVTRSDLAAQTISTATIGSTTVRQVTDYSITWRTGNSGSCSYNSGTQTWGTCLGWRDDLLTASSSSLGEKQVSNPVLLGGTCPRVIFTTLIPSTDICGYGGSSWLMELDPTNGGTVCQDVFDITGDGTANSSDRPEGGGIVAGISPGIGIMPEPVILRDPANSRDLKTEAGSTGAITTIKNYNVGTTGGRQSWRQLK